MLHTALQKTLDFLLPPRCPVSGKFVETQGALSPQSWTSLTFITDPACLRCGVPMEFDLGMPTTCTPCQEKEPVYTQARAALVYNDASRDLALKFKHGDRTDALVSFVPWMERVGKELLQKADLVVPVPLHRRRLLARRYNQSALIAQALSQKSGVPCAMQLLVRKRATPPQGHLHIKEREKNVAKAFLVNPDAQADIKGKNILLIDDVLTTGATVNECARVLLKEGAKEVNVLTLARVLKS